MRIGAIVCFVIAALGTLVAVQSITSHADRPEGAANLVGYAVGSFLIPVVLLIAGLIVWGKSGEKQG